jgi:hypothetical protein
MRQQSVHGLDQRAPVANVVLLSFRPLCKTNGRVHYSHTNIGAKTSTVQAALHVLFRGRIRHHVLRMHTMQLNHTTIGAI